MNIMKDIHPKDDTPNRIEALTKKLYSRVAKYTPQRTGVLHSEQFDVNQDWKKENTEDIKVYTTEPPRNFFKTFFVIAIFFFLIALGFVGYTFFRGTNKVSSDNISINVIGNSFTPGGEALPLEVEIANQNALPLELSDLIIEYPKTGSEVNTAPGDNVRTRRSVGTVAPGKIARQKLDLILVGEEGSTKQIKLTLEYRVQGSTVAFRKERLFPVKISSAPLLITLDAPTSATAGQPYTARVTVSTNTSRTVPNMLMKVEYPIGFTLTASNPKASLFDHTWILGDIVPGQPKTIEITGIMQAENGEDKSLRVYVGEPAKENQQIIGAIYTSKLVTAHIGRPPVDARLVINGESGKEVTTQAKSTVQGQVVWSNNLATTISDMEIVLHLNGALIDKRSVQPFGGYYNSSEGTIVWNKNTTTDLASVAPGQTGTFTFSFGTFSLYNQGQVISGTPEIDLDVSIRGKESIDGGGVKQAQATDTKKIRFSTDFQVVATPSFYNGPFTNTGPLPPRANQKTTYTIKWTLTNTANPIAGAEVRGSLPVNVHLVGTPSPATADLRRDDRTGEIVWKAGDVARGAGFGANPKTVYFQVELLPSVTDISSSPVLMKNIRATGTDSTTGTKLEAKWNEINIKLYNDQNYSPTTEKVLE